MDQDTFLTIQSETQGIYKDRGSKFLSFAYPVANEEEIKRNLNHLKKKYHDAKHHCFAFRIGTKKEYYRANDDGEPSGTAGKPIFGQIVSKGLTNILVVVVRYFGGTLLGTSGLINAYRAATIDCLTKATMVELQIEKTFEVYFPYEQMNSIMRIVKDESLTIGQQQFEKDCRLLLHVREREYKRIVQRLANIKSIRIIDL